MAKKECPPEVFALVEHLRSTGTGEPKLEALVEHGKKTSSAEAFLTTLHKVVPEGTIAKISTYFAALGETLPLSDEPIVEQINETEAARAPGFEV